jgi:hypothetical protein
MALNPLMGRWVNGSVAKLISDTNASESLGVTFFAEGIDDETPEWFHKDSLVLRITGPTPVFGSGIIRYRFEVMVMLTDLLQGGQDGFLNHDRLGTIANVLCSPIPVYAYGSGDAQVGCLDFDRNAPEPLRIVHFGKLDKDTEVVQAAVIARYEICQDS